MGGDYIDELILNHLLKIIYDKTGICKDTIQRENKAELYLIARDLKERLSGMKQKSCPYNLCNTALFIRNKQKRAGTLK